MSISMPVPPKELVDWIGGGDFLRHGERHRDFMITLGGLKQTHQVLDVGCGSGRTAVALLDFLKFPGRYDGFDAARPCIEWCKSNVTTINPIFQFQHVDVFNGFYNPSGTIWPHEFLFPYPASKFDFVCLWSVFTHLLQYSVSHYLCEIHRVLRPGGRCFMTAFLLDDESKKLIAAEKSSLDIRHPFGKSYIAHPDNPEGAVGYETETFLRWISETGLELVSGPHLGSWSGRKTYTDYQDIIVLTKP